MTGHFAITAMPSTGRPPLVHLQVSGELDLAARDDLRAAIVHAVSDGSGVTVDLEAVTFLDSEALGALFDGHHAAEAAGVPFRLSGAHGSVRRVLEITGVLTSE
jgi:anti-sigma B factor antagonist